MKRPDKVSVKAIRPNSIWQDLNAGFPLTLTLSAMECISPQPSPAFALLNHPLPLPRERDLGKWENCRQSVGKTHIVGSFARCSLLFPLPGGEGQGEGKIGFLNPMNTHISE